jgi:cation diffusion facilitator family transporter
VHSHNQGPWVHDHLFDAGNRAGERGTRAVMWITLAMMLVEITAGWYYNSMALLADGIHMSSHAVAIGLSAFAYALARRHVADPRYAFGTWKIEVLGGFASAVFLMVVVALMLFGSIERLLSPMPIRYGEAMVVAVVGLIVNVVCALILGAAHDHGAHEHHHADGHHHDDLNLRSAYVHVVTDALTSLLAIVALAGGWLYGWNWLDPAMGIASAVLVAIWARGLLADTARVLLDREMDAPVVAEIRSAVSDHAPPGTHELTDLHVWRIGKDAYACALSVVTHDPALTPATVREWLAEHEEIVHATIEIHQCPRS